MQSSLALPRFELKQESQDELSYEEELPQPSYSVHQ